MVIRIGLALACASGIARAGIATDRREFTPEWATPTALTEPGGIVPEQVAAFTPETLASIAIVAAHPIESEEPVADAFSLPDPMVVDLGGWRLASPPSPLQDFEDGKGANSHEWSVDGDPVGSLPAPGSVAIAALTLGFTGRRRR